MFGWGKHCSKSFARFIRIIPLTSHPADDAHEDYKKVQNSDNQAELSHEILAGGASFMAMKEWEDHQRKSGRLPND